MGRIDGVGQVIFAVLVRVPRQRLTLVQAAMVEAALAFRHRLLAVTETAAATTALGPCSRHGECYGPALQTLLAVDRRLCRRYCSRGNERGTRTSSWPPQAMAATSAAARRPQPSASCADNSSPTAVRTSGYRQLSAGEKWSGSKDKALWRRPARTAASNRAMNRRAEKRVLPHR